VPSTAAVQSGETVEVSLGGTGRPVTGVFAVTGPDAQVNWSSVRPRPSLKLNLPQVPMPDSNDRVATRIWRRSAEGIRWLGAQHSYPISVASDGKFRVEDIPAGSYTLQVTVSIPDPAQPAQVRRGAVTRQITIPEMPGGRSDTPLDLGRIVVPIVDKVGGIR